MTDPLFEPLGLGSLQLDNRIVLPAMHLAMGRAYQVTDPIVDFYARRAEGGVGLAIVGYATIDARSGNPSSIGAHEDSHVEGLARLAAAIQAGGARAAVQLNHAGRYNYSILLGGEPAVAPSAVYCRQTRETPRALEEGEIGEIIAAFASAARRVAEAGYDAVELLAGTGYLISQFLSPFTNLREDAWGGDFQGRARFGLEVVRA
ncbi:MAG: NADH:flavin oxidoreductase, partial [Pseudomonadota bacterium]